jgi:glycosyltransferase involved in cell wall biosynthesis
MANVVQVANMCQAFALCGADVILAIAAPRNKTKDPDDLVTKILGESPAFKILTYKKFTLFGRMEILGTYFGVRSLLRKIKADLCYVRDPLILQLSLKAGLSTVFEAHDSKLNFRSQLFNKLWENDMLVNVKRSKLIRFITISRALGDYWRVKGIPEQKITVLHDGFSSRIFEIEKKQIDARKELSLPVEKKIVVYAGRLNADREAERLIYLAKNNPDVSFIVIGGPEAQKVKLENLSSISKVRNISWIGHISHVKVAEYLFAADVLLMIWTWQVPHVKYFSPLKMFEYMAAGRIIVGEAFPTITEVLENGRTAYLADPDSFEDLCVKLNQALNQSYPSAMATRARQLALEEYSWNNRARKILESVKVLI